MRRLLIALTLITAACASSGPNVAPGRAYRIVGYVRGKADIEKISANKLTHINYAFAKVNESGEVFFNEPGSPDDLVRLQALKSKNPDLKILVSIGGWGADNFSDATLTDASRDKFAKSALAMLQQHRLDGIDLDWEYPGQPGPGIKFRPEDKQNFTALLRAIREQLDALSDAQGRKGYDRYLLTIASAGGPYFRHTEMDKLHHDLDFINVMTYDFTGNWSKETGHHSGLYPTTEAFVRQHLEAGIPSRKIVVGVAFWGKSWITTTTANHGLGQTVEKYDGDYSWSRLAGLPGVKRYWDEAAAAPYLWDETARRFISYDDPESLRRKAEFIRFHRLGGAMYWEHSHDDEQETLLTTLWRWLR